MNQQHLPFSSREEGKRQAVRTPLPALPALNISYSTYKGMQTCKYAQFCRGPGAYHGWDREAPRLYREAYALKRVEGVEQWVGHLVHDWSMEDPRMLL